MCMYARFWLSEVWVRKCWYVCAKDGVSDKGSVRGGLSRKRRYVRVHGAVRVRVWKWVSREDIRVEAVVEESAGVLEEVGMK